MDVDQDRLVDALSSALRYGGSALGDVPELLKRVLVDGVWRDFTTRRRQHVHHDRFIEFVTTAPPAGLGCDVELLQRIVAHDGETSVLLRKALKGSRNNITGTRRDYTIQRLERDAPELHAEVLAGHLSAHAAMVKGGFRTETFSVRADPVSAVRTLRKHMTAEQLATLVRLLVDGD